jgi:hypothetical protein
MSDQPGLWEHHEGLALGHAAAEEAADHAGEDWKELAYSAFTRHAETNATFITENVRDANKQIPDPPDNRAWGAVALRAKRERIVEADGHSRATHLRVHGNTVTLWRSLIFNGDRLG